MSLSLAVSWVLPWVTGASVYMALNPRRAQGWIAAALGHGLVLGPLLAALATDVCARSDTTHAWTHAGWPLAAVMLLCGAIAWRRVRVTMPEMTPPPRVEKWKMALCAALLATLAWRAWIALREILLRPTFPWDAWDAWAVKSKTWFLLGHYAPFVPAHDWLALSPPEAYSGPAWSYPSALAWMQVWFASAAGGWVEPLVNLPWLALWVGMLLAHFGQWRALGLSASRALVAVYALGSLPLLTVHVALAGYADLWMAALFGLAVLAWLRWRRDGDSGQLVLALACAAVLPWLKLEGAVWLLLLAGVAGFAALPRRLRWRTLGIAAAIALVGAAVDRLPLPLLGLGWAKVGLTRIEVPVIGALSVRWHGSALAGVSMALFGQSNWNLLWWIAPAIVVWRWRELCAQEPLRLLGALLLACTLFLLFLFLFTDAARWAESYTAINRLLMHVVPATVSLMALLLRDVSLAPARGGTAPASSPHSHPE